MSERDDSVYLRHILEAIAKIERYLTGIEQTAFDEVSLLQDGVIRQLQIIGEAARRLSLELRGSHADVPWQDIVGMRHKLVHDYFGVDLQAVWLAATQDVPALKRQVRQILSEMRPR